MKLTYNIYFKLINAILVNDKCHINDSKLPNGIGFISKDNSYNPILIYDKIIENGVIELINLIISKINIHSEEFGCCSNSNSMWVVNLINGIKSFVNNSLIWGTLIGLTKMDLLF